MQATMWPIRWLIAIALATLTLSAAAFERTYPATTLRGTMTIIAYPVISMDSKNLRLAPGSRIWNQNHLTQIPVSLGNSSYLVNYTQNAQGDVDRVWILTTDEASQPVANQLSNLKW